METTTDNVITRWDCHEDSTTTHITLSEVVVVGTPLCPDCEQEMTLADTVTVHPITWGLDSFDAAE